MQDKKLNRVFWLLYIVLGCIILLPLFLFPHPPMQDYPARLLESKVYHEVVTGNPQYTEYFESQSLWMTNRATTWMVAILGPVVGWILAGKLVITLIIVLTQVGLIVLLLKIAPEKKYYSFLFYLVAWHLYLMRGSLNYSLGLGLSFLLLALWIFPLHQRISLRSLITWKRIAATFLLSVLILWAHPIPIFVAAHLIIADYLLRKREKKWIVSFLVLITIGYPLMAIPLSKALIYFFGQHAKGEMLGYAWGWGKISALVSAFFLYKPLLQIALYVGVFGSIVFFVFQSDSWKSIGWHWIYLGVFLAVLILFLPSGSLVMVNSVESRISIYFAILFIASLPNIKSIFHNRFVMVSVLFVMVYLIYISNYFYQFNQETRSYFSFLSTVKSGQTYSVRNDWNFRRPESLSEIWRYLTEKEFNFPYVLAPDYYGVMKDGLGGFLFLISHQCALKEKKPLPQGDLVIYSFNGMTDYEPSEYVKNNYQLIFHSPRFKVFQK